MSDHSLQKVGNKKGKCPTIYHQNWDLMCLASRKSECLNIVCKKRVRKLWNFGPYLIKSKSGDIWMQEGVNV